MAKPGTADASRPAGRVPATPVAARVTGRTGQTPSATFIRWGVKPVVWAGCLTPLAILIVRAWRDDLTANPIELLTNWTGYTTLTLLVITLAVTPIRRITGWNSVIRLRRLIGLFAFFYALLHFSVYIGLDQFFAWSYIVEDVMERPYITVGFTAFLLLIPLALTSTRGWIRRLGRRWQRLHRLVYVTASLGVLHFYWKVKADTREPLIFAGILAALFLVRLCFNVLAQRARARAHLAAAD
jgi:sulfoxide reductase heme-binding subunit YedZ